MLAAGRARRPEAQADLIRLAGDGLYPAIVRATGLALLGAYPDEKSTAAFERALTDEHPLVRYTAVGSVAAADPQKLVELVAPLLFDPLRAVRLEAATRLAAIRDQLAKPYQQNALREALAEYQEAMEYSLDFAFAGHNLGNLHTRLGEPARVETYYREAITIDDLFYPAKVNLATLYNSMGRNQEAEMLLRGVLDFHPELDEVAYSLALRLAEMGRPEEAVPYLEQAAAGLPQRSRVHYNLGLLYQRLRRRAAAEQALLNALALDKENIDYLYALADHYVKRGEPRKALSLADRMIRSHPENQVGHQLKAHLERALQVPSGE